MPRQQSSVLQPRVRTSILTAIGSGEMLNSYGNGYGTNRTAGIRVPAGRLARARDSIRPRPGHHVAGAGGPDSAQYCSRALLW